MSDSTEQAEARLHATTDAQVWAEEFDRIYPDRRPDTDTMLGWFANAIEVGRMAGALAAPPPEAALRAALLTWFDTTHGNEFGHEQPHTQPIFEGCTCGWSDVQRAEAARDRLPASPADPEEADHG